MATLTKKDLLEAIEDMPMDMPVKICRGSLYVGVDGIYLKKLWVDDRQIEVICIESKLC